MRKITLEKLRKSKDLTAEIWRLLKKESLSESGIARRFSLSRSSVFSRIAQLRRSGWIAAVSGTGCARHPWIWSARESGRVATPPSKTMARARERLDRIAREAREARKSALVSAMSRGLAAIEKSAIQARDDLYVQ